MQPQQHPIQKIPLAELDERFTPAERARLGALLQRLRGLPGSVEFGLDPQRLQFARWLVEHDRLRETC